MGLVFVGGCGGEPPVIDFADDASEPVCAPGTQTCDVTGERLLVCQGDGLAFVEVPCEAGCVDSACVSQQCAPNTNRCVEPKLAEACDADGTSHLTVCDHGCINGECTDVVCVAGKIFCEPDGDKLVQCSIDGLKINEVENCAYGCDKASSACLAAACGPGEKRCSPDAAKAIEICNDSQTGFVLADIAECSEKCENGDCYVSACTPGDKRCGATSLDTCNAAGTGYQKTEECDWGCLDNGAGEALCLLCLEGAYACYGNTVVFCASALAPWAVHKDCKDIDTCAGGQCVKVLSLEGKAGGESTLIKLTEAVADCWLSMKAATKKDDVCRGLHTLGLDGDITADALSSWFCDNQGESITADDFSDPDYFEAAKDVYGCGLLELADLSVNTPGEAIHGGLSQVECLGHEKNEIIIAQCDSFSD